MLSMYAVTLHGMYIPPAASMLNAEVGTSCMFFFSHWQILLPIIC
jgi:hypothetical protein